MLQDLLNVKALTAAFHHPKNVQDVIMPSKQKTCEESIYKVSSHTKKITLEHCVNEINYNELRQQDIDKEKDNLDSENTTTQQIY